MEQPDGTVLAELLRKVTIIDKNSATAKEQHAVGAAMLLLQKQLERIVKPEANHEEKSSDDTDQKESSAVEPGRKYLSNRAPVLRLRRPQQLWNNVSIRHFNRRPEFKCCEYSFEARLARENQQESCALPPESNLRKLYIPTENEIGQLSHKTERITPALMQLLSFQKSDNDMLAAKPDALLSKDCFQRYFAGLVEKETESDEIPATVRNSLHPYALEIHGLCVHNNLKHAETKEKVDDAFAAVQKQIHYKLSDAAPLVWVRTTQQLEKMIEDLRDEDCIAIDVEHHHTRSYRGFVCLIQISSRTQDYMLDPIWNGSTSDASECNSLLEFRQNLSQLNEITANPRIVKVLHGADRDIGWLQRDFGLYIVNLFDTGQAMRALNFPGGYSLLNLYSRLLKVIPDKSLATSDWRERPLPNNLVDYARMDTHYLLYCYFALLKKLFEKGGKTLIVHAYQKSKGVALKCWRNENERLFAENGWSENVRASIASHSNAVFGRGSVATWTVQENGRLERVLRLRDYLARIEDESCEYVLPVRVALIMASDKFAQKLDGSADNFVQALETFLSADDGNAGSQFTVDSRPKISTITPTVAQALLNKLRKVKHYTALLLDAVHYGREKSFADIFSTLLSQDAMSEYNESPDPPEKWKCSRVSSESQVEVPSELHNRNAVDGCSRKRRRIEESGESVFETFGRNAETVNVKDADYVTSGFGSGITKEFIRAAGSLSPREDLQVSQTREELLKISQVILPAYPGAYSALKQLYPIGVPAAAQESLSSSESSDIEEENCKRLTVEDIRKKIEVLKKESQLSDSGSKNSFEEKVENIKMDEQGARLLSTTLDTAEGDQSFPQRGASTVVGRSKLAKVKKSRKKRLRTVPHNLNKEDQDCEVGKVVGKGVGEMQGKQPKPNEKGLRKLLEKKKINRESQKVPSLQVIPDPSGLMFESSGKGKRK